MRTPPALFWIGAQAAVALVCGGFAVVYAANGFSWAPLFCGFLSGANLVFVLGDLRDRYRILSGALR